MSTPEYKSADTGGQSGNACQPSKGKGKGKDKSKAKAKVKPKSKAKAKAKHKIEYKLYERPNLGAAAHDPNSRIRQSEMKLINTYQRPEHAALWMTSDKPDRRMVYVLQKWVDGQHVHYLARGLVCSRGCCGCTIVAEQPRTFDVKWAWNARQGWHRSHFRHRSEQAGPMVVTDDKGGTWHGMVGVPLV